MIRCPECCGEILGPEYVCRICGPRISERSLPFLQFSTSGEDRFNLLNFYHFYCHDFLTRQGGYKSDSPPEHVLFSSLPWAVTAGYRLVALDSEVRNGGFYQWLTNSSGQYSHETLEILSVINAHSHVQLVQQVLDVNSRIEEKYPSYRDRWDRAASCQQRESDTAFWEDIEANFLPQFDELSNEFYSLEERDTYSNYFYSYVNDNPHLCCTFGDKSQGPA
ncbi:DMP19 family protein [Planctomicrobium sp. SH661]|uniref:DMP19 family protein n=1 Tax=Planctomicrobium sp. SH661 TaxID=3448124 RepID=UPI003F5CBB2A